MGRQNEIMGEFVVGLCWKVRGTDMNLGSKRGW